KGAPAQAADDAGGDDGGDDGGIPCDGSGLSKGPLVLHVDGTSAIVRWEACREGTPAGMTYTQEDGGSAQHVDAVETPFVTNHTYRALNAAAPPDYAGTWYMHEADLGGLTPGACYQYGLDVDPTVQARFCTARNSGDEVRFLAIGDTNPAVGSSTTDVLSHVLPKNPDFTLHGGDIEYYDSFVETYALWFQLMKPMLRQGAIFAAIGNHDTDVQTGEPSDKYEQYTERFFGNAGFDGTPPDAGWASGYYDYESGGIWFFALDTVQPLDPASVEYQWLVNRLQVVSAQPGYRFSIVYMHEPFWTCGDTGDNPGTLAQLMPVFAQYKVPLMIQAHMHGYERFEAPGLTIVTAAGGGGAIGDVDAGASRAYCSMRVASGGFFNGVLIDVTKGQYTGTTIDDQGVVRDSFTHAVP
ncbi:MAG TPA: metallophosphoesterase, partial [Polyangiaceae bacterium]